MGISEILHSLIMVFILIVPGYIFKRLRLINEEQTRGLSSMISRFMLPALIIDAMQIEFTPEVFQSSLVIAVIMVFVFIVSLLLSFFFIKTFKIRKSHAGLFAFLVTFPNTGFVAMPVINALFGKEAVFYCSIAEMINDIFIFTIGAWLIQSSTGVKAKFNIKQFFSPAIVSILIGYVLFITNTRLPALLGGPISMVGSATTVISMFFIGSQLGDIHLKELFNEMSLYLFLLLKLILVPFLVLLVFKRVLHNISMLSSTLVIIFGMPTTVCVSILTEDYSGDTKYSTKGVLLSTIFCILSIPIFAILLQ